MLLPVLLTLCCVIFSTSWFAENLSAMDFLCSTALPEVNEVRSVELIPNFALASDCCKSYYLNMIFILRSRNIEIKRPAEIVEGREQISLLSS